MMRLAWVGLACACTFRHGVSTGDAMLDAPADTGPPACETHACKKAITIDGAKVIGGPHGDFPVLIHLASDPDLAAKSTSGNDLVFTDAQGTPLSYERQLYVAATGELVAWVRVPSLPSGADTLLYLGYGGDATTDHQDAAGTWSSAYQGVWHLDDTGTTVADSTAQRSAGTAMNGLAVGAAGHLVRAAMFDGVDDEIQVPASTALASTGPAATFGLWIWWTAIDKTNYHDVMSSSNRFTGNGEGYEWATQGSTGALYFYPNGATNDYDLGPNPFTAQTWQYLVVTLDFNSRVVAMYVDGVAMTFTETLANATNWTSAASPGTWIWGDNTLAEPFDGMMDELRVANVVRSPDWIATEFANQSVPSTFYTVGPPLPP